MHIPPSSVLFRGWVVRSGQFLRALWGIVLLVLLLWIPKERFIPVLLFDTNKHIYVQAVGWGLTAGNPQRTGECLWKADCPRLCGGGRYSTASPSQPRPHLKSHWAPTPKYYEPPRLLLFAILDSPLTGQAILGQSSDLSLLLLLHL